MAEDVLWSRLTAAELNERAKHDAIVILPVASTEQHGPHLGTGVDAILCAEACRRTAVRVAEVRPVVVAPCVWMGLAEHHVALGGTFTLTLSTWHALLRDLCQSIKRAGFARIVIVNGHGGNMAALSALTTDLTRETGLGIATTSYWSLAHDTGAFAKILERQTGVQHACEAETSMMMAVAPDHVRGDRLSQAFGADLPMGVALGGPLNRWRSFQELTPSGVLGDARVASAAKGEQLLDAAAELLAEQLLAGKPWA
ncbi:MAG: creatininase family protein [Hyphomicrobiaceae bacterium]